MDKYTVLEELFSQYQIQYQREVPLKEYTTFKIGGNAAMMVIPDSREKFRRTIFECVQNNVDYFVLGKGSNLLVSDHGYHGVVIYMGDQFQKIELIGEDKILCQAGASLASVCKFALEHSLTGLEFAFGIPGSIGGAAYMNAGAYDGEMKDVIYRCEHVTTQGAFGIYDQGQLDFSYRHSAYTDSGYCITDVYLQLHKGDPQAIKARMMELLERRKTKQPLEYPSAGSTFKRPEGAYASALIEECGLKGKTIGGAQVSEKHSGFLINTGNASCQDVKDLIEYVQQVVFERTGFHLDCEVKWIGE